MEQRPLRLGDIVDDYCPRERRLTNHAIVAIVGVDIKQTRCTTCDAEHVYKGGREPKRRTRPKDSAYEQVLREVTGTQLVTARAEADEDALASEAAESVAADPEVQERAGLAASEPERELEQEQEPAVATEGWLAHRRLIRATLPKTEGTEPPARPIPEFTMHQRPVRHGRGQPRFTSPWSHQGGRGGNANGNVNGNVNGNTNGTRHAHGRPAEGNGNGPVQGDGQGRKSRRRRRRNRRRRSPEQ
jgi:hypothetical protein